MKNNKGILFTLISLGALFYFFANFQRIAIPGAIFDLLQQELAVSAPYITAFGAIFMYLYAVNQLIIGVLVDRYGESCYSFIDFERHRLAESFQSNLLGTAQTGLRPYGQPGPLPTGGASCHY